MKLNLSPRTIVRSLLILELSLAAVGFGCANRNKADIIDTNMEHKSEISNSNGESVGVRDKEFVLQKKKNLAEALRSLEEKVRELDDRVYGTREYETYGLWGQLRNCRDHLKEKKSDFDAGPVERMSDSDYLLNWKGNSDAKAGIEKSSSQLVALSEEDLDDHIKKLNKAKSKLESKEDEIREKISQCKALGN